MRPLFSAALAAACLAASLALPAPMHATSTKVAIIVGPVGSLTPTYLALAETAAATAERHGAAVARAYSPNATPANVLAAVAGANIVIYFGHGYGHPSPYGALDRWRQNGWGLQGPRARGTHDDGLNGYLEYFGEEWIVANARPAPGFVMIYSNTCYAPGASEGGFAPATATVAAERVANYSRKVFALGGSAYYATDFDRGAADLVDRLLGNRHAAFGWIFAADHRFVPSALTTQGHWFSAGQQIWLHRTKYTDGPPNYWYAFAGNPDATPIRSWDPVAPTASFLSPGGDATDVVPSAPIRLQLSEPVTGLDPDTVRLLDQDGQPVTAGIDHDPGSGMLEVRPEAPLALSARYTLSLEAGIADLAGNPFAPVAWSFTTRLDADPLDGTVPVVLEPGRHRLMRFAPDGTVTEEQRLDLADQRWLVASARARLPGASGSWFELGSGSLAGWWVLESARAHAVGRTEEAAMEPALVVLAAPFESTIVTLEGDAPIPVMEMSARSDRTITVDRRVVLDGRTYLRLVDGILGHEGRWIEVAASAAPSEAHETRVIARQARPIPAVISLGLGNRPVFRFDGSGRVIEREMITGGAAPALATNETLVVGGARFFVVRGGELDGWAIREGPAITVSAASVPDPS